MSNPNPNQENLRNFRDMTPEERYEYAKKGAEATNKLLKERKTMREMLDYLLAKDITDSKGNTMNTQEAILVAQISKALKGDGRAFVNIRDTMGEKPVDVVQFKPTEESLKDIEDLIKDDK